jgi:Lar family restriction alleviation protein
MNFEEIGHAIQRLQLEHDAVANANVELRSALQLVWFALTGTEFEKPPTRSEMQEKLAAFVAMAAGAEAAPPAEPPLAPCPFCGVTEDTEDISVVRVERGYCVNCDTCEANGPEAPSGDEARKLWNQALRAAQPAPAYPYIAPETAVALARAERKLAVLAEWTHRFGRALCPPGADTYGEGIRDAKEQVSNILGERP